MMNSRDIFQQWLNAINSHDVSAMAALMAADFVFVDSLGNRVNGAKSRRRDGGAISVCVRIIGFARNW
jgi:ketosteroid isomerase-like protein